MGRGKSKRVASPEVYNIKDKATDDKQPVDQSKETSNNHMKRLEDLPGLGPITAQKLREFGYNFMGLATARADEVSAEMGPSVSYIKAKSWITAAQESILSVITPKSGKAVAQERKLKRVFYKTGSDNFNNLLGGGFATMRTTGMSGRFSTGKTQALFDAIVDCLSKTKYYYCPMCNDGKGFLHDKEVEKCSNCGKEMFRKAAYIETEPDTYSDIRIEEIARLRNIDIDLENLWIYGAENIPTPKGQFLMYKVIMKQIQEQNENIGLICIDSFTAKFRPGYGRRELLPVRTREFAEHFHLIDFLASRYNIAWALSCQVIGSPDPGSSLGIKMKTGDGFYPVGGEYLLHSIGTWVNMTQIKTELYEAIVYDSSYLPRSRCEFMLTKSGLKDGIK